MEARTEIAVTDVPLAEPAAAPDQAEREQRERVQVQAPPAPRPSRPQGPAPREADLRDIREGRRNATVLRRDTRIRRGLAVADVVSATLAVGAAMAIGGHPPGPAPLPPPPPILPLFQPPPPLYPGEDRIPQSTPRHGPALPPVPTLSSM